MDNHSPLFTVVIPSTGGLVLKNTLLSVQQTLDCPILVVCDNTQQKNQISSIIDQSPNLQILIGDGPGVAQARNFGLKAATTRYVLFIDDDCLIEESETIHKLFEFVKSHDSYQAWGGRYRLDSPSTYWSRVYHSIQNAWLDLGLTHQQVEAQNLLGGFLVLRKDSMQLFENSISWGGEETLLLRQLQKLGLKAALNNEVCLLHRDQSGIGKFFKRAYYQGLNRGRHQLKTSFNWSRLSVPPIQLILGWALFFFTVIFSSAIGRYISPNKIPKP